MPRRDYSEGFPQEDDAFFDVVNWPIHLACDNRQGEVAQSRPVVGGEGDEFSANGDCFLRFVDSFSATPDSLSDLDACDLRWVT